LHDTNNMCRCLSTHHWDTCRAHCQGSLTSARRAPGGDFGAEAPPAGRAQAPPSALALAAREADDDELAKLLLTPSPPRAEPPA